MSDLHKHLSPTVTIAALARYCEVPEQRVLEWIDSGLLRAGRVRGEWRLRTEDAIAFEHSRGDSDRGSQW